MGTPTRMKTPQEFASRVIELHGGHDAFFAFMDAQFREFNEIWDQDAQSIGRVLRSHLAVEYFLTRFLSSASPNLGSLDNARLTFSQKVELISELDPTVSFLKPGLRRLNAIQNRMAHRLRVEITSEDRDTLLGIQLFAAMREESARRNGPKPDDALSVVEQFAMFASSLLHAGTSPSRDLWRQATESQGESAQQGSPPDGGPPRSLAIRA